MSDRAALLDRWLTSRRETAQRAAIPRADRGAPLRLSSGQRRLWFQELADGVGGDRNVPLAWRLDGALDRTALFDALDAVVGRHEALRTEFVAVDGEPYQRVREPYSFERDVVDVPPPERDPRALGDLVEAEAYRAFDFASGRMLHARLFRIGEQRHVLLLVAPHLVVDDWSIGRLWAEVAALYSARAGGEVAVLPELGVQYPDFAEWQRSRLESGALDAELEYWKRELHDVPAVLDLPTDRPRAATPALRAAWLPFRLDAKTVRAVERLAADEGASAFMVLLAIYALVLARWSGSSEVVIGSAVAGRSLPELEPLIGFFVNTVPLRVRVDRTASFRALVRSVRATLLGALEHQEVPFDHLVRTLAPERSGTANALVQVAIDMNTASLEPPRLAGLNVTEHVVVGRSSRYDLVLAFVPEGDTMRGELVYDTDLFDATTVQRFVAQYADALGALTSRPDAPIRLAARERALDDPFACGAQLAVDPGATVPNAIAAVARAYPDRAGVRAPDGTLSYAELDRRSDDLAALLAAHGVGPETTVAVHCGRSVHLVVALIAVWKLGAAFLALDPAYPADALRAILDDASPLAIVSAHAEALPAVRIPVVDVARVPLADAPPRRRTFPDALAYVVYTSGTTGRPKGVQITYRNVANLVAAIAPLAPPAGGVAMNVMAPSFDGWLWSTILPLAYGSAVLLVDPLDGGGDVFRDAADIVTITPSLLAASPDPLAGPPTIVVAGEACPPALIERWSHGRRFVNAYGPSETTICATWADSANGGDPATIGTPIANCRAYVLDEDLQPVPRGLSGELFVAGSGVGRGYRGRPGLTAATFLADPFEAGGRMYRTGDVVRRRADGALQFLHRTDQQLKVRGFRVEPAGIERAAAGVPGVRSASAFVVTTSSEPRLGLAVVPDAAAANGDLTSAVRDALSATLPDFMVPAYIVQVDRLPMTSSGKIDQAALAAACASEPVAAGRPPATPTELRVAQIWSDVLQRPVDDAELNFFDLGGHSLLATRIVAIVRRETGLRLTIRQMLARPTVAGVAAEIDRLAGELGEQRA